MTSPLPSRRPPVVLLGGTNLVRALGLAGIPVIVTATDPDEPALASRYCVRRCLLPSRASPDAVVEALIELGVEIFRETGTRPPLMYGNDGWLELIHAHRERLQGHFLMVLNDSETAHSLMEKSRFAELAHERNLPVPVTLRWEGDGVEGLRNWPRQVVVKPRQKMDWHDSPLHKLLFTDDSKALVFEDGAAAMAHPLVERYRNQLLFQEFIPGGDAQLWSFHGYADEKGEVLACFVGRKIRTYPPITGESAYVELAHDPGLMTYGRIMAQRVPLRGAFKIDFKKDPRDGRLLILEINARWTLWHYVGAVNGVNLCQVAYEHLVEGRSPRPAPYSTRRRWMYLRYDWLAYRELAKRGELSFFGWLRSLVGAKVYNIFSWSDPGPFAALWIGRLTRRVRRLPMMKPWRSTAS